MEDKGCLAAVALVLLICVAFVVAFGCDRSDKAGPPVPKVKSTDGMVMKIGEYDTWEGKRPWKLTNTNEFTVVVYVIWVFKGETTQKIFKLSPGESRSEEFVSRQHLFRFYRDGAAFAQIDPV